VSSELRSIAIVAYRDIARFWRYKYWLAGHVAMNLADILIFGLIFNGVVNKDLIPDYVRFVTPGILCLSIFISSFSIGREVGVELRREVTQYLLTLPVRRESLIIGRLLRGSQGVDLLVRLPRLRFNHFSPSITGGVGLRFSNFFHPGSHNVERFNLSIHCHERFQHAGYDKVSHILSHILRLQYFLPSESYCGQAGTLSPNC